MAINVPKIIVLVIFGWSSVLWAQTSTMDGVTPVPIESGKASLSADNAMIQFVGTHAGEEPNPRVGVLEKFFGAVSVTDGSLDSIHVD